MGAGSGATLALEGCTESPWSPNEGAAGRLLPAKEPRSWRCAGWVPGPGRQTAARQVPASPWTSRGQSPRGSELSGAEAFVPSQRAVPRIKAPPPGACCLVRGGPFKKT